MMLIMTSKKIGKGSKGALWHESNLNPICHSLPPDDDDDDDDDDDIGLPAYSHQSYSHLVGICHNDEWWEYDLVTFPS